MAKRFTDSGKWADPWFAGLSQVQKVLWLYLCDACDTVGIWKVNLPLAGFYVGEPVDLKLLHDFGRRLVWLTEEKVWLPGFLKFQYSNLSGGNKAHRGIMRKILQETQDLPLEDDVRLLLEGFETLISGSSEGQQTLQVKDKEKEKVKVKEEFKSDAEKIYAGHPRKLGKQDGIRRLIKRFENGLAFADAKAAQERFLAHHKSAGTEKNYLPYFGSFVSDLDDWLEADAGQSADFSASDPIDKIDLTGIFKKPKEVSNG